MRSMMWAAVGLLLLVPASACAADGALPSGWDRTLKRAAALPVHVMRSGIFESLPWQQVGPGVRRQVAFSDRLTLVRLEIRGAKGRTHDLSHWHPHDQITHLLEGEAEVVVGTKARRIGAGATYVCQSGVPHSLRPISDTIELVEAFTPVRDDFRGGRAVEPGPSAAARPLGPNEVRAFVYEWFSLFDRNASVGEFLPHLAERGLWVQFPERTLRSKADFTDWYAGVLANIESATHELSSCDVEPNGTRARVTVRVLWRARTRTGQSIALRVRQKWLVSRSSVTGRPVIHSYRVTVL